MCLLNKFFTTIPKNISEVMDVEDYFDALSDSEIESDCNIDSDSSTDQ